jgi:hypothetical protein
LAAGKVTGTNSKVSKPWSSVPSPPETRFVGGHTFSPGLLLISLDPLPFHELEHRLHGCRESGAEQHGRPRLVEQHESASVVGAFAAA